MIFLPVAVPLLVLLLVVLLVVLVVLVELRVLSYAYQKIGIRPRYVFLIMLLTLVGSPSERPSRHATIAPRCPSLTTAS